MKEGIYEFKDEHRYLSNFYVRTLVWDGLLWPHSEAAYQAAKTLNPADRDAISRMTPSEAKQHGKTVLLRPDWENVKYSIMKEIVYAKFSQNPELRDKLIATGTLHLEEGNHWNDRIWGVCPARSGQGKNWLGQILMEVRTQLINEQMLEF